MAEQPRTFIFAGGGSGGHLYPGLAVAERIREQQPDARIVFLCSDRAIDAKILGGEGIDFVPSAAGPVSLRPGRIMKLARGWIETGRQVRALIDEAGGAANVVMIAMGGFVAAPAAHAAKRSGARVVMVNLDAVPGKANRLLVRWADEVLSAAEQGAFDAEFIGPIVRKRATPPGDMDAGACRESFGLDPGLRTLLVTGGSQGANSINNALAALAQVNMDLFDGWQVLHQCGDEPAVGALRDAYGSAGIRAEVRAYIDEMGTALGAADLTICRAGAGTVGEVWASELPAVFLPYPHHRDDHQRANAGAVVRSGAAVIADDQIEPEANRIALLGVLEGAMRGGDVLVEMREAYEQLGECRGAERVAERAISAF